MSISFLLGSGVSIPAGLPKTAEITAAVLSGDAWRATDSRYFLGTDPNPDIPDLNSPRVVDFVHILKSVIDGYYEDLPKSDTNYEDIYYVADQIRGSESGLLDNPAIGPLIEDLKPKVASLLAGTADLQPAPWTLQQMADETCNYIRDVAWHMIADRTPGDSSYLGFLYEASTDEEQIDIFTLNHDTLTEQYLADAGVKLCDGFGELIRDVRVWEDEKLTDDKEHDVRLFKLHGSVDWFDFVWNGRQVTMVTKNPDVFHTTGPHGLELTPVEPRPKFLAGTGNKPLEYQAGLFVELHQLFYRWLRLGRRLVVVGYGFGDAGINQRVFEWLLTNDDATMVVTHPDPAKLKANSRWNLASVWGELEAKGKIRFIATSSEHLSWMEIKTELAR